MNRDRNRTTLPSPRQHLPQHQDHSICISKQPSRLRCFWDVFLRWNLLHLPRPVPPDFHHPHSDWWPDFSCSVRPITQKKSTNSHKILHTSTRQDQGPWPPVFPFQCPSRFWDHRPQIYPRSVFWYHHQGIFFHFTQAVWRKAQLTGLLIPYREDGNVKKLIRRAAVHPPRQHRDRMVSSPRKQRWSWANRPDRDLHRLRVGEVD